jgi:hypothetical protein
MASAWIVTRPTRDGGKRYRVHFQVGGRGTPTRYAGTFKRRREALARKSWVVGELAAMRVPGPEPAHDERTEGADRA